LFSRRVRYGLKLRVIWPVFIDRLDLLAENHAVTSVFFGASTFILQEHGAVKFTKFT